MNLGKPVKNLVSNTRYDQIEPTKLTSFVRDYLRGIGRIPIFVVKNVNDKMHQAYFTKKGISYLTR